MTRNFVRLFSYAMILLLFFILQKPLFMLYNHQFYADASLWDYVEVIAHGSKLDLSITSYLLLLPSLMFMLHPLANRWLESHKRVAKVINKWLPKAYCIILSILLSAIFVVDLGLYEYWGFRLDSTPLFYFFSSPADALASVSVWIVLLGIFLIALLSWLLVFVILRVDNFICCRLWYFDYHRTWKEWVIFFLTFALIFLGEVYFIRGGFSVSTQNTGSVYYSDNMSLNHAAVNPAFSLLESLSHENDFASMYRFMDAAEADRVFAELQDRSKDDVAHTDTLVSCARPNVVFVIMESFGANIMESLGGEKNVTPELDRIASEGILFTRFYANSFRTDRGLVAILSGFPAQPTVSVMKYPKKSQRLPSIAHSLRNNGYTASYYYGGDANFTNMRSYLVSSGFTKIVSDDDFSASECASKWGAYDEVLFNRVLQDLAKMPTTSDKPSFVCIQTSSSHEPFEVPYQRLANQKLNAFAYTDHCIGEFVSQFRKMPQWQNTILVFVADHLGCWPDVLDNHNPWRYHIPLIVTGGAVAGEPRQIDVVASQNDIAATLLGQLGINHDEFLFSKDILNPGNPHFAFFDFPDIFGMKTADAAVVYDNQGGKTVYKEGTPEAVATLTHQGQAYLQKIFDTLAQR